MTKLAHFYHVYCATDQWREPVAEHLWALDHAGYDGPFHVGIVGSKQQRAEVIDELHWTRPPDKIVQRNVGWEQVTLKPLLAYAQDHDDAILYAHTKGAHDPSVINVAWRRSMTHHLIGGWRNALEQLGRYQAVGCHWLTAEQFPAHPGTAPMPCFGGNYWMARCSYLRTLPPCPTTCRHDAEAWIGTRRPRVLDLTPGWPGNFGPVKHGRLIAGR